MKEYWGVEVQVNAFLISDLDGQEEALSCCGWSICREKNFDSLCAESWIGPRPDLHAGIKPKFVCCPAHNLVTIPTELE
jgi:hypothetical protein